jgi:quinol monooxygenase YgiN
MRLLFAATVMILVNLLGHDCAVAQDIVPPIYVVSYIEVAPHSVTEARQLILSYSADARKAPGAADIDAMQRIGASNHFALVEQWKSRQSKDDFVSTPAVKQFRAALGALQSAPYDERVYGPITVGSSMPSGTDSVVVLTHVDVVPTSAEAGTALVKAFAEQSRGATGNLRFDALVQASRRNHMTLVESWSSFADKEVEISTSATKSFRQALQPMSGSLYDERAYKLLR